MERRRKPDESTPDRMLVCMWRGPEGGSCFPRRRIHPGLGLPPELTKAIAYYATLTSYADTGTIVRGAPGLVDTLE